jgi:DNA-binding NarL/FixJ family response regulator
MDTNLNHRPLRVFLVEDSPLLKERMIELLREIHGVELVGSAEGADEAIEQVLEVRPDAVVLDIRLAEGTGFDVLRAVNDRAPEIDFYMLSNFASATFRQLASRLGARDFFDKSTEMERMRDVIAQRAVIVH